MCKVSASYTLQNGVGGPLKCSCTATVPTLWDGPYLYGVLSCGTWCRCCTPWCGVPSCVACYAWSVAQRCVRAGAVVSGPSSSPWSHGTPATTATTAPATALATAAVPLASASSAFKTRQWTPCGARTARHSGTRDVPAAAAACGRGPAPGPPHAPFAAATPTRTKTAAGHRGPQPGPQPGPQTGPKPAGLPQALAAAAWVFGRHGHSSTCAPRGFSGRRS